ncbi:nucleotidyltransferase family protein [Clostridium tyrobutyricum]|uniref:nucleotidyltransferase family protein n=1 Tax=Clostridium tyrobutyricum TaxID=1519 RepID=UPI0010AAFABD|nr:nucleotidyltransferase family protein [Clostridium tyrobutyricum]QCH26958.1 D-glycero-alpha-D-manno-heptose 1-phosphate guanylyltransferase [Clostridium tyrobutyricum]
MNKLNNMFVGENNSIIDALNKINENNTGTVIVIGENRKLLGTLTDGDIRRALINNVSLNSSIKNIYNKNCKYIYENYNEEDVQSILKMYIKAVPIVDKNKIVVDYVALKDFFNTEDTEENPVLIMAGGLGTRLRPLTDDIPKPMLKVGDKPIIQTIIEQFRRSGYKNIFISVNYKSDFIKNYFRDGSDFGVSINYIEEDKRMGTAGAIRLAEEYLNTSFFVINGDILTNINFQSLMKYHINHEFDMTIGSRNYDMQVPYGVLNTEELCITSLEEKPVYSFMVSGGIYVLNPQIIKYIPQNKYYDITQLINLLINKNRKIGNFPIQEYWMDIGKVEDYHKANEDIKKLF